jgi:hypothetical protein
MPVPGAGRTSRTARLTRGLPKTTALFVAILALSWTQGESNRPGWCKTEGTYRVLLVGDSWAAVSWLHESLRKSFAEIGRPSTWEKGDVTSIGGSRADQWKEPEKLDLVTRELTAHPSIDCVHVFLGGNDFVNAWNAGLTPAETERSLQRIVDDLAILVDCCLAQQSNVSVVLCGYDYLDFVETTEAAEVPWCATGAVWEKLGNPSPRQLNDAFADLETRKAELADSNPRVFHVNNFGQMQYHFGYPSKNVAPFTLEPPGNPDWPSPPEALNNGLDCMHLNEEGYLVLARNCCEQFYEDHFK